MFSCLKVTIHGRESMQSDERQDEHLLFFSISG
jgi:hypothetical protein